MNFRIGQRVRLLHEEGDGVIVRLIDQRTVEVDMGDDFPIDVDVDEVIPVDSSESSFFDKSDEKEAVAEKRARAVQQLGSSMLDISLVIMPHEQREEEFRALLVNPEPADMLFSCYIKVRNRYQGQAAGRINSGEFFPLFTMPRADLNAIKTLHFQLISFVPGKGHPHAPLVREMPWTKGNLHAPLAFIPAIKADGWAFSLREDKQVVDIKNIDEGEFIRVRQVDQPKVRRELVEVDLHIEELVKRPALLATSEMLRIQLEHLEIALSNALADNHASLVIIHGVGEGVLRKQVRKKLQETPHVKSFDNADPKQYGNGATLVTFE
jgi:hypothetical protein